MRESLKKLRHNLRRGRSAAASPAPSLTPSTGYAETSDAALLETHKCLANVQSPEQGDVVDSTKTSSDATEPYAPPNTTVTDVQATQASADAGAGEPHLPATPSTLEKTPTASP